MAENSLITPDAPPTSAGDEESLDVWGYQDTQFRVNDHGHLEVTGDRYPLSGQELPDFLPWVRGVMQIALDPKELYPSRYPTSIPEPVLNQGYLTGLRSLLQEDQISFDPKIRLRHGHGHTQQEMYAIKYGHLDRIPDLVVTPTNEDQVAALVEMALKHNVCLIPFGGGTSVTEALVCPSNESRMIVSVDMRRMNRILWIDSVNRMAKIQAGAVGMKILEQLKAYGFTLGHEPDSVEFSTLGGWIATHASGMKKNKYGNIEELVLDMTVVTSAGMLEHKTLAPRESIGTDPRRWLFGSEGNLGIVTSAVVKIFPYPKVQRYGSVVFPDFERGLAFLYELAHTGKLPASIRMVDNLQFQFGLALKPRSTGFKKLKSTFEKFFITRIKGFDPMQIVACTIVFEGAKSDVHDEEKLVYGIARRHGGLKAGAENGRRGYLLTYCIAYIRDFVMRHFVLAESFETSVSWSQAHSLCDRVKRRIVEEHEKRKLPGRPFVTCRITQLYETGVCIYFYFGFYFKGIEHASEVFAEVESAARDEILKSGGSLSHHHGVGKLRERFLPEIKSAASLQWIRDAKKALDPQNIFGSANQLLGGPL